MGPDHGRKASANSGVHRRTAGLPAEGHCKNAINHDPLNVEVSVGCSVEWRKKERPIEARRHQGKPIATDAPTSVEKGLNHTN
jgi:hypothetical protein